MRRAFSLVELSIVLVILGLLVGGILAGQSLIRAAELRSVGEDYSRYMTANHAFRDKYFALPGDFSKATNFWGAADGSTGTTAGCYTTNQTSGTATCNGSGDGMISRYNSADPEWYESFLYYKHLTNAGLIAGQFSGNYPASAQAIRLNLNVPPTKLTNAFFLMVYRTTTVPGMFPAAGNLFWLGLRSDWAGVPVGAFMAPENAWNIDRKIDDGLPGTGKMRTTTACATGTDPLTAEYNLGTINLNCNFTFITGL